MNMMSTFPSPDSDQDLTREPDERAVGDDLVDLSDTSAWARLGSFSFRRRRFVLGAWIAVLVGVFVTVGAVGSSSDSSFESPDSDSSAGFTILEENFGVEVVNIN